MTAEEMRLVSLRAEERTDEPAELRELWTDEAAPVAELRADPAAEVAEPKTEEAPPGRLVMPLTTLERGFWAEAAPAERATAKMVEKRMLMVLLGG